jgi:hypothetical protein
MLSSYSSADFAFRHTFGGGTCLDHMFFSKGFLAPIWGALIWPALWSWPGLTGAKNPSDL